MTTVLRHDPFTETLSAYTSRLRGAVADSVHKEFMQIPGFPLDELVLNDFTRALNRLYELDLEELKAEAEKRGFIL